MSGLIRSQDLGLRRLGLIGALVTALMVTLVARLYYVQILDKNKPVQSAGLLHDGAIVVPAPRGDIVDSTGIALVSNRTSHVITIDGEKVRESEDGGRAVLSRLAALLAEPEAQLSHRITPCSPKVSAPCWTGEPYQPVPVTTDASTEAVLAVSEHREQFPGVEVLTQAVRYYPNGSLASHVLGYSGAITDTDKKSNKALYDADTIGRSGLEEQYDKQLRGVDGTQYVKLDARGYSVGNDKNIAPAQGDTLVTSINGKLQKLAEDSVAQQIADTRKLGKPATSAAAVVMDPNTGRVLAVASYPTYNPQVFVGGISTANYKALTSPTANDPLVGRAIQGQYAPGSTFKLITSSSLVANKEITLTGKYPCPGSLAVDGRVKTNYESHSSPYPLNLAQALQVSCDTFFYAPEANEYYADQSRIDKGQPPNQFLQAMARAYGIGSSPGLDLPANEQASGSYADRQSRMDRWNKNKDQYCANAAGGYPDEPNPAQRAYLTTLAKENCTDGWRYRAGDNADMSIGQGETTMSPMQLAIAYSAMINGGTVWNPALGWAVVNGDGKVVQTITPTAKGKLPVTQQFLNYYANSLQFQNSHSVSGALAFDGSPYKTTLGGKTGTAEVQGHVDTSWIATWGPVGRDAAGNANAKFVVVGMVEQAGTGASAAGPMVRRIYDGILGVGQAPVLAGSTPPTQIPPVSQRKLATNPVVLGAPIAVPGDVAQTTPTSTPSPTVLPPTKPTPTPAASATPLPDAVIPPRTPTPRPGTVHAGVPTP